VPVRRFPLIARVLMAATLTATGIALAAAPGARPGGASGVIHAVALTGDDAAAGTPAAPWRTLGHALHALQPGETLLVGDGTFVEDLSTIVVTPASASAPVLVTAAPGAHPVLQGLLWLHSPSWWTFSGLGVTWDPVNNAEQHMVKVTGGDHWRITGAEVWGARSYAAILVAGTPADWSLDHLYVHDTIASHAAGSNQDHLIYVNANSGGNGGVIEHNVLARSTNGRAIKVGPSSSTGAAVANVTIRSNTMVDNEGPSNVQIAWSSSNVTITGNIMDRPASGRSAVTAYELTGTNNVVSGNLAWDAARVLDTGVAGLVDGGGNLLVDPQFANAATDDFVPTNPLAVAYGAFANPTNGALPPIGLPVSPPGSYEHGYRLVSANGRIVGFGGDASGGLPTGTALREPIVGAASTPSGAGAWLVARDGGIFTFGDAHFLGSTGAIHLNQPIVGMTATPTGNGYWLVARDGGIFTFGDAQFLGSTGAIHLNQPIVGMTAVGAGGYRLVASDGGVFTFGDAPYLGSTGAIHLNQPIVALASDDEGSGYRIVASDGGIFTFGDAPYLGSTSGQSLGGAIVACIT